MLNRYLLPASCALVIAVLTALLYLPFLNNALVFDDHGFFTSLAVYDSAQTIFNFRPRTFPYFTLGLVQVEIGSIEAQRIISLILHILCDWMLFALLTALLRQSLNTAGAKLADNSVASIQATILGLIGALWFAIDPVAVYGAGYLVQRTILFATLFSLLSLWYYQRAFAENRMTDVITAALFYSAAVFSKEHAVLLPLAAVALTALYSGNYWTKVKQAGFYLLLCLPAAITAILSAKSVIASSYEPYVGVLFEQIHGIPLLEKNKGPWLVSALMQAGFFFDYIAYWVVPNVSSMSIDMKINFSQLWATWWVFPKAIAFFSCPIVAFYLLRRGGLQALFGCGLLYSWLLFLTELSSVRFQEPFVLYRSYLWAPGYALMVVAICRALPPRWAIAASIPVFAVSFWLAQERLESLSNEGTVWKDAAAKLESESIVGAGRILYMRGRQYIREKKFHEAIDDFTHAIPHYPTASQNYYQRGIAYYSLQQFKMAQADFDHALLLNKNDGSIQYARGLVFEHLGCIEQAIAAYTASQDRGVVIAELKLHELAKKTTFLTPKKQAFELASCPK